MPMCPHVPTYPYDARNDIIYPCRFNEKLIITQDRSQSSAIVALFLDLSELVWSKKKKKSFKRPSLKITEIMLETRRYGPGLKSDDHLKPVLRHV
jgi:hypothetical protein